MKIKEIGEEFRSVITGKTMDALIPPMIYLAVNALLNLRWAIVLSVLASIGLVILRLYTKKSWKYAFSGFIGVLIAAGFAYFADNAVNYYVPELLTSVSLILIATISLIVKRPLAAWLSHLTRGWTLSWFWRMDVRPAYTEVTFFWLLLFVLRSVLLFVLLIDNNITGLFIINTLLGLPVTGAVLALSYIYGIWRLKNLGGPGIEEFENKNPKPWKGQTRGF